MNDVVAFLMVGMAAGVVVTALASAVNAPTPLSLFVNLFLGVMGLTAGATNWTILLRFGLSVSEPAR
jgi:hypothetical protein